MSNVSYDSLSVGDEISAVNKPAISRHTLALYCGGSGDHNPIHVDSDFAKAAGMPDVFAHGMLSMAYLGQALTGWVPQSALRSYGVRFASITWVGNELTCGGTVTEKFEEDGEKRVRLEVKAADQDGDIKLIGEAVVALD
ncbi:MAG: dehydratase [Synechococcus sp. EAC657]|nr:dehydratase [Synechococcus sp. EAC657]|tara:strand:- start:1178 stop:1597 length:420 start_codon:yes stop_codon:yes gene_type:complete